MRFVGMLAIGMAVAGAAGCRSRQTLVVPSPTVSPTSRPATSPIPTPTVVTPTAVSPSEEAPEIEGRIVFHRKEMTGWLHIYVLDLGSGDIVPLTDGPGNNYDPAWSADGSAIAFISDRDPKSTYGTLWVMAADGSDQRPLLPPGPYIELGPTWSPDGTRIAFQSNREGNLDILVLDLDSEELTNLTQHPGVEANPAWSPDGTQIAFVSDRDGSPDVWVVNVDGTSPRRITLNPALGEWRPAWSPSGDQLIFESYSTVAPRNLLVQDLDGSVAQEVDAVSVWNTWPTWVTDQIILYAASEEYDEDAHRASPANLYMQHLGTGKIDRLTSGSTDDGRPSWSP